MGCENLLHLRDSFDTPDKLFVNGQLIHFFHRMHVAFSWKVLQQHLISDVVVWIICNMWLPTVFTNFAEWFFATECCIHMGFLLPIYSLKWEYCKTGSFHDRNLVIFASRKISRKFRGHKNFLFYSEFLNYKIWTDYGPVLLRQGDPGTSQYISC